MKTSVIVGFSITGEKLVPSVLTKELEITPTKFWVKGDLKGSQWTTKGVLKYEDHLDIPIHMTNYWRISTSEEESQDVNVQIVKIVQILGDKIDTLNRFRHQHDLEYVMFIVIYVRDGQTPACGLSSSFIDFIQSIKASIDIDLYCS